MGNAAWGPKLEGPILVALPLITVDSRGEVSIYRTPDQVSHWLEAQDVRDGEFRLFDCRGLEYSLSAETDSSSVTVGPPIGEHLDLVRQLARTFLDRLPARGQTEASLQDPEEVCEALEPYAR